MSVVSKFKKKLKELEKAIYPTIEKTIDSNKPLIIDQQTDVQLYQGKDSNNKELQPSYALSTKIIKKKKGQPTDRVTLNDTSDLYNSIKIDTKTNEFIISANVTYFKYLVSHYSKNSILGLDDKFLKEFTRKKILPNLEKNWKNIISK